MIIGGGIVGASVADHLAGPSILDQPPDEIVVVDRVHPGKATLAGAGIVCPWATAADDGTWYDLYAAGGAYYEELLVRLAARTELDVGYRRVGALVVSHDSADLDAAEERLARRSVDNPEVGAVRRLDAAEAQARFPPLTDGLEAVHIANGARVDGRLLAEALLAGSGASRIVSPAAAEVVVDGGQVTGVRVDGLEGDPAEVLAADVVVVAGGA
ncbi:MAG: FAD-dependent oxidoreductase, partial [Actinomycetota bacterium]